MLRVVQLDARLRYVDVELVGDDRDDGDDMSDGCAAPHDWLFNQMIRPTSAIGECASDGCSLNRLLCDGAQTTRAYYERRIIETFMKRNASSRHWSIGAIYPGRMLSDAWIIRQLLQQTIMSRRPRTLVYSFVDSSNADFIENVADEQLRMGVTNVTVVAKTRNQRVETFVRLMVSFLKHIRRANAVDLVLLRVYASTRAWRQTVRETPEFRSQVVWGVDYFDGDEQTIDDFWMTSLLCSRDWIASLRHNNQPCAASMYYFDLRTCLSEDDQSLFVWEPPRLGSSIATTCALTKTRALDWIHANHRDFERVVWWRRWRWKLSIAAVVVVSTIVYF